MVSIKQCLEEMHSGATFSLKVVKWDQRRISKRGELLEIACAQLVWGDGGSDKQKRLGERGMTPLEKKLTGSDAFALNKKDPNHQFHYTRNIRVVIDGRPTETIHKIRPLLIIEFNGQTTTP